MLSRLLIVGLNQLIRANPSTQSKLSNLNGQIICLTMPFFKCSFTILEDGFLKPSRQTADSSIDIPLAAAAHLIHHQAIRTLKQIRINGNKELAMVFLSAIATINPSNILYQQDSQLFGTLAVKLESLLQQIISYAKLITDNFTLSTSEYIQHEVDLITDKYQLEKFYSQVDELNERCQLLTKRLEKIMRS